MTVNLRFADVARSENCKFIDQKVTWEFDYRRVILDDCRKELLLFRVVTTSEGKFCVRYTVVCKKNDNCLNLSGFNMSNLIKVYDISF